MAIENGFLRYVCLNRPVEGNDGYECRSSKMGGVSIDTLKSHDFSSSPFVDYRYCHKCRVYIRITISSLTEQPTFEVLTDEEYKHVQSVTVDELFGGCKVFGRKVVFHPQEKA